MKGETGFVSPIYRDQLIEALETVYRTGNFPLSSNRYLISFCKKRKYVKLRSNKSKRILSGNGAYKLTIKGCLFLDFLKRRCPVEAKAHVR
jgi:hypothetical protein